WCRKRASQATSTQQSLAFHIPWVLELVIGKERRWNEDTYGHIFWNARHQPVAARTHCPQLASTGSGRPTGNHRGHDQTLGTRKPATWSLFPRQTLRPLWQKCRGTGTAPG